MAVLGLNMVREILMLWLTRDYMLSAILFCHDTFSCYQSITRLDVHFFSYWVIRRKKVSPRQNVQQVLISKLFIVNKKEKTNKQTNRNARAKTTNCEPPILRCIQLFKCDLCDAGYSFLHVISVTLADTVLHQRVEEHERSAIGKLLEQDHNLEANTLDLQHFSILKKCKNKLDCLIYEFFLIFRELKPD